MPPDYSSHLATASEVLQRVVQRNGSQRDEAEDFRSWAMVKLIENDYAVFRKFQGRSKLTTYLTTVANHLFLDYRNHMWGKWRPSALAKRLGPVAIRLETLVYRDGHTFADAVELVRGELDVEHTDDELETVFGQLKPRYRRRFEGEEPLQRMAAAEPDPEVGAMKQDLEPTAEAVGRFISTALAGLAPQCALILKLRFAEGMRVVDIARLLGLEQRPLYTRIEGLLTQLRAAVMDSGISSEQVSDILGWDALDLEIDFGSNHESNLSSGSSDSQRPKRQTQATKNKTLTNPAEKTSTGPSQDV